MKREDMARKKKMIKALPFRCSFLLLLTAALLCLAACKQEPDDILPDDPHLTVGNPFTGVWNTGEEYWEFRRNGTGGRADTAEGPFPDDFSFLVYAGQDVQTVPAHGCMVIVDDANAALYHFFVEGNKVFLNTEMGSGLPAVELERVSGEPQPLSLSNLLIGEWSADWTSINGLTWSLKYREDGTLKTYHHQVKHQFENAYVLRGNTLVIFGDMRFSVVPVIATMSDLGNGMLQVIETQPNPPPAVWVYTRVIAAEWL